MNTLLVATDLSPRSDIAVARAARLTEETGARLVVLSVIDEDLPEPMAARMKEEAQARIAAGPGATRLVVVGDPLRDIPKAADEEGADLVVLGMHRSRPILDMFRSTTMEKLVRLSARPILIAKNSADRAYERAVACVDLSPSSVAALRAVRSVAPQAALHAFHAYSVPFKGFLGDEGADPGAHPFRDEAASALAEWRAAARLPDGLGEIELVEGSVAGAFSAAMTLHRPDLVAMGAHSRAALSPTLLGSFVTELLRDPPTDLLIARR